MTDASIRKLLIANRGEIACRIIRTCQRLGIRTLAIHSAVDRQALHVSLADEAIALSGDSPLAPYLNIDAIIDAAKRYGADAIHPGYGFLSENAAFASACSAHGLIFVGPPASAIDAMGSKSAAKAIMAAAGVPLVPGYHGAEQASGFLQQQALTIGFPLLIKATYGGGGKGMRVVTNASEFTTALAAAKREAKAAFADDTVLLERYLTQPRHIEVQIFADQQGHCIYLGDRDCSLQRRHQKVIEEAPAPGLSDELRQQMGQAAIAAAKAIGYCGAGTIEFLLDSDQQFYFMEMNTRLQVEHPVTELITGQDLVAWQLSVAAGQPLPLTQQQVTLNGHAVEARIYAEDPSHNFLPASGPLSYLQEPTAAPHLRLDTGVRQGDVITPFYDPLIAKLIIWHSDRSEALRQLTLALQQYQIAGVWHNIAFLAALTSHPAFIREDFSTHFIAQHLDELLSQAATPAPTTEVLAAAAMVSLLASNTQGHTYNSPWQQLSGFRLNAAPEWHLQLRYGAMATASSFLLLLQQQTIGEYSLTINAAEAEGNANTKVIVSGELTAAQQLKLTLNGHSQHWYFYQQQTTLWLLRHGHVWQFDSGPQSYQLADNHGDTSLLAPMNGTIVTLLVQPGDFVRKGCGLLVLEAMKMEYQINAPTDGIVDNFLCRAGELVQDGTLLVQFSAKESD
ncbi:acetyl/propionyl/methylcrotonyl-CoA carboxylase subunit alpha [Shewanella dokdonensis]|uniref:Acetyl-CoA carboxylase biotin carboxylase subunit n=1 Tax=Shewanella dokdonensis TaxID=712036 RepID=A0ABX8DGD3_9GAMM|nr:acetyl-CoA carboxylase biotin carboxylase subunit [Shewanella dokdonensis]MCL1074012.1 acetyl-CoA carboxylase biotin carboxylase subunit [Shewanella dokdonensis]QVK23770.1 acetyl-CoA carboxylase biotin carboxylase subunit [Shewanella dokdonensis]